MKNVKDLVNLIVRGSMATKVTAGVVAATVVVGGSVGTYYAVKHVNSTKIEKQEMANKKQYVLDGIEILEENIAKLPDEEDTSNLKEGLEKLKSMDLEMEYEEANSLYDELSKELASITKSYKEDMQKLRKDFEEFIFTDFTDEEIKTVQDKILEYDTCVGNNEYKNYKNVYNEVIKVYGEVSNKVKERLDVSKNESSEETTNKENHFEENNDGSTNSESTNSGAISSSSTVNSSVNSSVSSNAGSSNSGSSNSGSSNSGSTNNSYAESVQTPAQEPVNVPQQPSIPSGYNQEVTSAVWNNIAPWYANIYDESSPYCKMSAEQYNYLYGIASNLDAGLIDVGTARSQIFGKVFDLLDFGPNPVVAADVLSFTVSGCDATTIYNAIVSRLITFRCDFLYITVYYDSSTDTSRVTYVGAGF